MLHSAKDLTGWSLLADDGDIGSVRDLYFDDHRWTVRHLVVETGGWLPGRTVLIPPHAVQGVDAATRQLRVGLTRRQVKDAPGMDSDRPVSRQQEVAAYDHYGYPYYWGGVGLWGAMDLPMGGTIAPFTATGEGAAATATAAAMAQRPGAAGASEDDPHLRSSAHVRGYTAAASDGDIGSVDDLLVAPRSWQVALLVVDTGTWLPGRSVLVPPQWVGEVDWGLRRVVFLAPKRAIEASPAHVSQQAVGLDETRRIQLHFEGWE